LNSKLFDNKHLIISGILVGYIFNKNIRKWKYNSPILT
jgi:hypothetical protein